MTFAIGKRRWWTGGGFDVLEGNGAGKNLAEVWPTKVAWFRDHHHAELFIAVLKGLRPAAAARPLTKGER